MKRRPKKYTRLATVKIIDPAESDTDAEAYESRRINWLQSAAFDSTDGIIEDHHPFFFAADRFISDGLVEIVHDDFYYRKYRITAAGREAVKSHIGITPAERRLLHLTAEIWQEFLNLPNRHPDDAAEMRFDLHQIQNRIMARVAVRSNPDQFRVGPADHEVSPQE